MDLCNKPNDIIKFTQDSYCVFLSFLFLFSILKFEHYESISAASSASDGVGFAAAVFPALTISSTNNRLLATTVL